MIDPAKIDGIIRLLTAIDESLHIIIAMIGLLGINWLIKNLRRDGR